MMLLVVQAGNSDWTWIGSGCFVIIGALIAYLGTRRTLKMQREITEQQIKSAKEVNQAQMNEKLLLKNRVAWDNETRELIAKLIGQLFSINHVIEKAQLVTEKLKMAKDANIPVEQRMDFLSISEEEKNDLKTGMESITKTVETVALIRLHLFEDTPNELQLWNKISDMQQHMSKLEKIPSNELEQLTELARTYFLGNWGRLMMMNDTDNDIVNTASHRGDEM